MNDNQTESSTPTVKKQGRPKLVWVVSIFYVLSAGYTLLSFILIYGGIIQINETQQEYFRSQNMIDISLTMVTGLLNFSGAVMLFLLKRYAFHAFVSAFVISMFMTILHILFKNWIDAIGGPGLVGAIIGWLISISIIIYTKSLLNKGILK